MNRDLVAFTFVLVWICCRLLSSANALGLEQASHHGPTEGHLQARRQVFGQPLPLILPDENHRFLVLDEITCLRLESLSQPIAVIAATGAVHAGKSFLLNQLLHSESSVFLPHVSNDTQSLRTESAAGFQVGKTVDPTTRGLWVWDAPVTLHDSEHGQHQVLLLDTEGFAAATANEMYDAKIFSVATLLSSVLLFNSVKMIDQAGIDSLELLSRRAQLFAVRALYEKFVPTDPVNSEREISETKSEKETSKEKVCDEQTTKEKVCDEQTTKEKVCDEQTTKEKVCEEQTTKAKVWEEQTTKEKVCEEQTTKAKVWEEQTTKDGTKEKDLPFPEFLWITQDFVSGLGAFENADQWLHSLLSQPHHRLDDSTSNQNHRTSLWELFPSVGAHTLSVPHTDADILALNTPSLLSPVYKSEVLTLKRKLGTLLKQSLKRKTTGRGVVALARFLVSAANEQEARRFFPSVPNMWKEFMHLQMTLTREDCLLRYHETLEKLLLLNLPITAFLVSEREAAEEARRQLRLTLKGWDASSTENELRVALELQSRLRREDHFTRLAKVLHLHAQHCANHSLQGLASFHSARPLTSVDGAPFYSRLLLQQTECFSNNESTRVHQTHALFQKVLLDLTNNLIKQTQLELQNAQARVTNHLLQLAKTSLAGTFDCEHKVLGQQQAAQLCQEFSSVAQTAFGRAAVEWEPEKASYDTARQFLKESCFQQCVEFKMKARHLAGEMSERTWKQAEQKLVEALSRLTLPMPDLKLTLAVQKHIETALAFFNKSVQSIVDFEFVATDRKSLALRLRSAFHTMAKNNEAALAQEFHTPLSSVTRFAESRAADYRWSVVFLNDMKQFLTEEVTAQLQAKTLPSSVIHSSDIHSRLHVDSPLHVDDIHSPLHVDDIHSPLHVDDTHSALHVDDIHSPLHVDDIHSPLDVDDIHSPFLQNWFQTILRSRLAHQVAVMDAELYRSFFRIAWITLFLCTGLTGCFLIAQWVRSKLRSKEKTKTV